MDIMGTATKLEEFKKQISEARTALIKDLSDIDKKQEDILHYIELNKWNAVQGMRLLKALATCRRTRRIIKEELDKYNIIDGAINMKQVKGAQNRFLSPIQRTAYKPKVVKDIFDISQYELRE